MDSAASKTSFPNWTPLRFSLRTTLALATLAAVFAFNNASRLRAMWANIVNAELDIAETNDRGMWKSFEEMHEHYTHNFVESEGMGMSRIATFDEPHNRMLRIKGEPYAVKAVRLIGLDDEKPRVYTSSWISIMRNQLDRYESRDANEFELSALERLRLGTDLVWKQNHANKTQFVSHDPKQSAATQGKEEQAAAGSNTTDSVDSKTKSFTLVGSLRAGKSCVKCHEARPNELLGAFVYKLDYNPEMDLLRQRLLELGLKPKGGQQQSKAGS
ncbi:MAG: hypothetical protein AAF483_00550 [Planctomycetota bacterium]